MINTYLNIHSEKNWQIQYPFMRNTFFRVEMIENFLTLVKSINRKPTANVILNNENACYPSKSIGNTSILTTSIKPRTEYPSQQKRNKKINKNTVLKNTYKKAIGI